MSKTFCKTGIHKKENICWWSCSLFEFMYQQLTYTAMRNVLRYLNTWQAWTEGINGWWESLAMMWSSIQGVLTTSCQNKGWDNPNTTAELSILLFCIRFEAFTVTVCNDASWVTINMELVSNIWRLRVSKSMDITPTTTWLIAQEEFVALLFWINDILGFVSDPEPWLPDWEVSWFCQVSSGIYYNNTFK
jgi:hypothetical protein